MNHEYRIRLVTPLFSYGADPFIQGRGRDAPNHEGTPEIRPASIRGHLRWWMRVLGYADAIQPILGSAAGNSGVASRVIVRVSDISDSVPYEGKPMPHKHWSKKTGFRRGTEFTVVLRERLKKLETAEREILHRSIEAWVMLGGLGQRVTRGSGALAFAGPPTTAATWSNKVQDLLRNSEMKVWVSSETFESETAARSIICNTLAEDAFRGKQPLGGIKDRKTSPLRMRPVEFADQGIRIAATWIGDPLQNLAEAIRTLQASKKPIGDVLASADRIK